MGSRRLLVVAVAAAAPVAAFACGAFEAADQEVEAADAGAAEAGPMEASGGDAGAEGGCAADLSKDPRNCGSCGHDCLAGACTNGACEPFVLASGLSSPGAIALKSSRIY
jgi:hypothetical protein